MRTLSALVAMLLVFAAGLVLPESPRAQDEAAETADSVDATLFATLYAEGALDFPGTCGMCHGADGGGGVGPALRQNTADIRGLVRLVVFGRNSNFVMPAIAWDWSDRRIAAILTYVRNSWGNGYGIVTEADVAAFRP